MKRTRGKKKPLLKWLGLILIIIMVWIVSFLIYVGREHSERETFRRSLENMPEVQYVLALNQFHGAESYWIAEVALEDGTQMYYFIFEAQVIHQVPVGDLMTPAQAEAIALSGFGGTSVHYFLGFFQNTPIFEVALNTSEGVRYVIVDAKTREIAFSYLLE